MLSNYSIWETFSLSSLFKAYWKEVGSLLAVYLIKVL